MFKYFTWIAGLRGPEAQIWAEKDKTREGKTVPILMQARLMSDDVRNLDQLKLDYPFQNEANP